MVLNKTQKYAIQKDRLNCVNCNGNIKGSAVKAGGNFWCKVKLYNMCAADYGYFILIER